MNLPAGKTTLILRIELFRHSNLKSQPSSSLDARVSKEYNFIVSATIVPIRILFYSVPLLHCAVVVNGFKIAAFIERPVSDTCDPGGDLYRCQAAAIVERIVSDTSQLTSFGESNAFKIAASVERISDTGDP